MPPTDLSPAAAAFWRRYLATLADPAGANSRFYETFSIGATREDADNGAALIRSGRKTATSSLLWQLEASGTRPPRAGDLSLLLDGRGRPVCVVETLSCEVRPLDAVDAAFARAYGEWDGSLATWRARCWDFYAAQCAELGRAPRPDMPLLCERLRMVFPAPGGG